MTFQFPIFRGAKDIWNRFYDSLQQGFSEITEGTKPDEKNSEVKHFPRAASISTQILAEFVNILPNTLHNVYTVVSNYLAVREKFDFTTIPELLVLFHSHDVEQEEQRLFILNAIYNGIKDDLDFKLLNNTPVFKMLFCCHGCPLSDRKIDLAILKVIDRMVTKTSKIEFLLHRYGLAQWIYQAAAKTEAFEYEAIEMILLLIEHCVSAIQQHCKDGNDESFKRLIAAILVLLPKLTKTRLTASGFSSILKIFNQIKKFENIDKELVIQLMSVYLPQDQLKLLTYLDDHPEACMFVESRESFAKSLAPTVDEVMKNIFVESREFVINIHHNRK